MAEFRIQRARLADWKLVRSVRLRALAESPDAFGSTLAEERQLSDDQWRGRSERAGFVRFLAMTPHGEAVGVAVGAPFDGQKQTAGLFSMWVAPEARKHGIGAALVQAVVAWAEGETYRRIVLEVGDANIPAIRLYESCGFVPTGRTGSLPPPRQHISEHEMERHLG